MSKFTQGKWSADEYGSYVFAHGTDMMICTMRGEGYLRNQGLSDEEIMAVQEANARLIAVAPEMYALLCRLYHDGALPDEIDGYDVKQRFRYIADRVSAPTEGVEHEQA